MAGLLSVLQLSRAEANRPTIHDYLWSISSTVRFLRSTIQSAVSCTRDINLGKMLGSCGAVIRWQASRRACQFILSI